MKKYKFKIVIYLLMIILVNIGIVFFVDYKNDSLVITVEVKAEYSDDYQIFYSHGEAFKDKVSTTKYSDINNYQKLKFKIPNDISQIRLDLGNNEGAIYIREMSIDYMGYKNSMDLNKIISEQKRSGIEEILADEGESIKVVINNTDPIIIVDRSDLPIPDIAKATTTINVLLKLGGCLGVTIMLLLNKNRLNSIPIIIQDILKNRRLIVSLAYNDFKTRYAGSYLGITWGFIQPMVVVLIYWFVFEVGFKSTPMDNFPFLLWLIAGIVPWFFFNEALLSATNSLIEYSYLVKKIVFKISVLPIVKITSALYIHIFFVVFANIIYLLYGYTPTIYMIQAIYYSMCTFVLALALAYTTSAIVIFFRDLGQIVSILLQFGMWITPIMWSQDIMPISIQSILKLNPLYYIVEGYRDTFIRHVWFWERNNQTIYFWVITGGLFLVGAYIFKKLKPHFSDVL